jgi:hypothetical protein
LLRVNIDEVIAAENCSKNSLVICEYTIDFSFSDN